MQNVSVENSRVRELKMRIVEKEECMVVEEEENSHEPENKIRKAKMIVDEEEKKSEEITEQAYLISGLSDDV